MKRLIGIIALILTSWGVSAQNTPTTRMVFENYRHDFGTINEVDGDVTHTFRFKNEGENPLVVYSVGTSCGCTSPRFSKEPVMPGKEGEVAVTFDPTNRPGAFEKVVTVFANDTRKSIRLVVAGEVVPRPKKLQDDYPYHIASGLRIASKTQELGTMPRGRAVTYTMGVANGGKEAFTLGVAAAGLPDYVTVKPRKTRLEPQERSEVVITVDGAAKSADVWGKQNWTFKFIVNGKPDSEEILLRGIFTEDFSGLTQAQRANAPIAQFSSLFYHFSEQKQGQKLTRQFEVKNTGKGNLIIRHLGVTSDKVKAVADRPTIKPGATATIIVTLETKGVLGRLSEGVTVVTNDPERPSRDIWVLAEIVK